MNAATIISSQQQQQQDDPHSKKRTRVTPTQLSILEDTFSVSATPDSKMRKHLAQKLQMPERSIQIWFQNRRAKVKMLQRRALLREEQEMARAKMYAEAAAAAAAGVPPLPPSSASSASSYWYGSSHLSSKLPIQRAWSSDPAPSHPSPSFLRYPPPPPPPQPSHLHHHQYHQHHHFSSMYSSSFTDSLTGEVKDGSFYNNNMSPSPTPNPMAKSLDTESFKSFQETTFIDNMTPAASDVTKGVINANAVTIGTWHRMKINQQDLLCCFQLSERTFEWHIRDSSYHFKMVISFDLVTSLDITVLDNGIFAQMDMKLSEPPLFFMENMDDLTWIQCSDFTEGMQATCHLHHTLRGLATDLRQELLGMISLDQHLCQVITFPTQHPPSMLPMSDYSLNDDISALDPSSLMSWRHQSVPLNMKDFEWSHPSTTF